MIPIAKPLIDQEEKQAVLEVLGSGMLAQGPRVRAFEDAFAGYAVPQAVLRFKQGFGRLIRSSNDRGVCAVLDRRILTKRYGATFLQSLPECTVEVGSARELPRAAREWIPAEGSAAAESQPLLIVEEG